MNFDLNQQNVSDYVFLYEMALTNLEKDFIYKKYEII